MESQNVSAVRAVYDAFAVGDVPAVLGFLTPDAEWTEADLQHAQHDASVP